MPLSCVGLGCLVTIILEKKKKTPKCKVVRVREVRKAFHTSVVMSSYQSGGIKELKG